MLPLLEPVYSVDVSPAAELFEAELRQRGVAFAVMLDGRYELQVNGGVLLVSLDNVSRDLERDGDPRRVARFTETVLGVFEPLPPWDEARGRIYWAAERSCSELDDSLHESVTDTVARVLVLTSIDEGRIRWLAPACLETWGLELDALRGAAGENLDALLRGKRLEIAGERGRRLGMVSVDSPLKASVIFAPCFKRFVAADLGWPVLVVIPCRDFMYVIADEDRELLGAVGTVVQREFRESGYPLTTEVLRISDDGIESIGHFPE
jgi:hypothetical protein